MTALPAGKLDRRIRLERPQLVADAYGDPQPGYSVIATMWAEVRPGQGGERFSDATIAATAPAIFIIRWSSIVMEADPTWRVRYPAAADGRAYDIKRVEEIGRRVGLRIFAVARAD